MINEANQVGGEEGKELVGGWAEGEAGEEGVEERGVRGREVEVNYVVREGDWGVRRYDARKVGVWGWVRWMMLVVVRPGKCVREMGEGVNGWASLGMGLWGLVVGVLILRISFGLRLWVCTVMGIMNQNAWGVKYSWGVVYGLGWMDSLKRNGWAMIGDIGSFAALVGVCGVGMFGVGVMMFGWGARDDERLGESLGRGMKRVLVMFPWLIVVGSLMLLGCAAIDDWVWMIRTDYWRLVNSGAKVNGVVWHARVQAYMIGLTVGLAGLIFVSWRIAGVMGIGGRRWDKRGGKAGFEAGEPRCVSCGYRMIGLRYGGACPECGVAVRRSVVIAKKGEKARLVGRKVKRVDWGTRVYIYLRDSLRVMVDQKKVVRRIVGGRVCEEGKRWWVVGWMMGAVLPYSLMLVLELGYRVMSGESGVSLRESMMRAMVDEAMVTGWVCGGIMLMMLMWGVIVGGYYTVRVKQNVMGIAMQVVGKVSGVWAVMIVAGILMLMGAAMLMVKMGAGRGMVLVGWGVIVLMLLGYGMWLPIGMMRKVREVMKKE